MTTAYTCTGRELAEALVADLNSGEARRIAKARKAAPAIEQPAQLNDRSAATGQSLSATPWRGDLTNRRGSAGSGTGPQPAPGRQR